MGELDRYWLNVLHHATQGPRVPAMLAISWLGSGWLGLLLLPLLRMKRSRAWATHLSAAVAIQAASVWILKRVVGRVRPWVALGLRVPTGAPVDPSFPSGHASAAFCVAVFALIVAGSRPRPLAARVGASLALLLATLVAVSRVCLGVHYPSDVLAGALLGGALGSLAAQRFVRRTTGTASAQPSDSISSFPIG